MLTKNISMNRQSYGFKFLNADYEMSGIVTAHRHDFAGLMYPNPDFSYRLCINSNVANAIVELSRRSDGERIVKLTADFGAMLELVSPENWPDVCICVPPMSDEEASGPSLSKGE